MNLDNFSLTASTGELKVLYEGRIMAAGVNESIMIDIKSDIINFKLEFKFIGLGGNNPSTAFEVDGENLIIKCENYNNPIGTGIKAPLKLTNNSGKNLYISFTVRKSSDDSAHELSYTFYSK